MVFSREGHFTYCSRGRLIEPIGTVSVMGLQRGCYTCCSMRNQARKKQLSIQEADLVSGKCKQNQLKYIPFWSIKYILNELTAEAHYRDKRLFTVDHKSICSSAYCY